MTRSAEAALRRMVAIVGAPHALTEPEAMRPHTEEWRKRWPGRAALVVKPGSTAEVAALVAIAAQARIAIVPQGGNTGLVGGQMPDGSGTQVVLSTSRLRAVRALDAGGRTLTVEAGVTLAAAQAEAERAGLMLPLSLASEGSAQIGGIIAANAGGVHVLAHGSARQLTLGVEVVLADGRVLHGLRGLVKDNTGYALRDLFAGSEGTLGIITAAVLRLVPRPGSIAVALVGCDGLPDVAALFAAVQAEAGPLLNAFELLPQAGLAMVERHTALRSPLGTAQAWYALIEVAAPGALAGELLTGALANRADAVLATSHAQAATLWAMRHAMSEVQSPEGASLKHDIAVPIGRLPAFLAEALPLVAQMLPGALPVPFGHYGDGNLHFNISQPRGAPAEAFLAQRDAVAAAVHALALAHGGTISAEHGIGQAKREGLAAMEGDVAIDLMRRIKHALDPLGILNPGKVLP